MSLLCPEEVVVAYYYTAGLELSTYSVLYAMMMTVIIVVIV